MKPDCAVQSTDPLQALRVIERLEVGQARVRPRALSATYTVVQNGQKASSELRFSYEEDVFDLSSASARQQSQNLADLIALQPALNYGLFADEIALGGELDAHDRQFISAMAENTAREIYVNKILTDNPFLVPSARNLPVIAQERYLRAHLSFERARANEIVAASALRSDDSPGYAVLSSGGKESLLSYGLLRELECDVHPIFVNESGRHWFTALNAYRRFSDEIPWTARVWTSADRLFNWLLRHLPIVRPDFAKLRADVYPLRLWTVAIFIFSALPLLRKRGIRYLIMGDEFDTTQRLVYGGISHYGGLYDQSRYFDQALSAYYASKGWQLGQLSLLRPLSELLIEKVLLQRYPALQREQVSCHAAHIEGKRIMPCGRCEKCRRIVAMLTALGVDPRACGHTEMQIRHCLETLAGHGVHQGRAEVEHLAFLLSEQGKLPGGHIGEALPARRDEVEGLRFDRERAPADDVPPELRQSLYRILLQYASAGALRNGSGLWRPFDLVGATSPPSGNPGGKRCKHEQSKPSSSKSGRYLLGELTWPMAKAHLSQVDVALLPVGAIEQHGPHLPLDTDAFDADYLARRVAESCSLPRPIVLPAIPYGVSYHHDAFAGTISISPETLSRMVHEIGLGVARQGIKKLVIINGHGGNGPALHFAAQLVNRDARIFTCVDSGETSDADVYALTETPNDVHAGEIETSTALATRSELVDIAAARKSVPKFSTGYLDFTSKRSVTWYVYTHRISKTGTLGDPTKASRDKGEQIWALMVDHLSRFVEQLKSLTLDEIHQRRY